MTKPEEIVCWAKSVGSAWLEQNSPVHTDEWRSWLCNASKAELQRKAREYGRTEAGKACEDELERRAFARYSFAEIWHKDP